MSFIQPVLKDPSSVSFNHPQTSAHIPIHNEELTENELALSLSNFTTH